MWIIRLRDGGRRGGGKRVQRRRGRVGVKSKTELLDVITAKSNSPHILKV